MIEDAELLRRYAESRSEAAFAELVQRRIGLVYSVALRQTRDAHRADDVVQAVFTDLARKAASLSRRPVLAGWLYRSAQFAAADIVRAEQRRARREQEAQIMEKLFARDSSDLAWEKARPLLDDAMGDLHELDRDAVLLRFFDNRSFADIGVRLKLTENAARMRVERALDKLHAALARRGVTSTAATLGVALAGQAGLAAPVGLAATVTGAALAGSAAVSSGAAFVSFMALSKLQMGIAAAVVVVGVGSVAVYQQEKASEPRVVATVETKPAVTSAATGRPAIASPATPTVPPAAVAPTPTREVAARPPDAANARPGASSRSDQIQFWLDMTERPAALRVLAAEARELTVNRFGELFSELNLGPERTETFARLLDEKRQALMDVAVASYKNGIDPRNDMAAYETAVAATRERIEQEIRTFLGDTAYAQYIAYNQNQGVRDAFIRLGRVLDGTPDVLTPQQTAQLQAVLKSDGPGGNGNLTAQKIAAAQAFLSPPQMEALEKAFAQQRNTKAGRFQDALPPAPEK